MVLNTELDFDTIEPVVVPQEPPALTDIRERLRGVAQVEGLSIASIGKLAGVGHSTVSAFLKGNYAGDNAKVAERMRLWLDQREAMVRTKATLLNTIPFTRTKTAKAFLGALEYAQMLGDLVVIVGGPGVGKTSSAEHYATTHPNVWLVTVDPSCASSYALLDYLVDAIGLSETSPHKRVRAIATRLRDTEGLLVIDDAQVLTMGAVETLRAIHDRSKIGMALIGNHEVWSRLENGGGKAQFAQVTSRVGARVNAPKPSAEDIDALLDAAQVVDREQRNMFKHIANKPGALRQMIKTLRLARKVASGADEELTAAHISHAYERLSGAPEGRS
jgi:DNA transposition AAA+ family ATPase